MHRFVLHNGEVIDAGDKNLSAGQVGLMNGWGVFSTIRVYDGILFAWERHYARMKHDAELMRVPFPADAKWLEERLYRLIAANEVPKTYQDLLRPELKGKLAVTTESSSSRVIRLSRPAGVRSNSCPETLAQSRSPRSSILAQ